MYSVGNIIYFTPFYFPNGKSGPKEKYFIVLYCDHQNFLFASLPTREDHVPSYEKVRYGCIDISIANFNCYHFPKDYPVTEDDWSFPLNTFVYGNQIGNFDLKIFNDIYKIEGKDYDIIGKLKKEELKLMLKCFANSKSVIGKYRKCFSEILKTL